MKLLSFVLFSILATSCFAQNQQNIAIFAGGCFWCIEAPFDQIDGVTKTTVGYTAGNTKNPTYEEVSEGETGHVEAIQITFNPEKVSYAELLDVFWKNIDPLAVDEQFCDFGTQYRSGIYYLSPSQELAAKKSLTELKKVKFPNQVVATEILAATIFYPAESYHQDYYQKNPIFYKIIRFTCGRDRRLDELWSRE